MVVSPSIWSTVHWNKPKYTSIFRITCPAHKPFDPNNNSDKRSLTKWTFQNVYTKLAAIDPSFVWKVYPLQVFIPSNGVPSLWTFPLPASLIIHGPLAVSFMGATSSILGNPQKDSSTSGIASPIMNSSTSSTHPQTCGRIKRVLTTEPFCPHGTFRTHTTTNVCGSWVPPPSSTEPR